MKNMLFVVMAVFVVLSFVSCADVSGGGSGSSPVYYVNIDSTDFEMSVGDTFDLNTDADGDADVTLTWKSSNTFVATVDSNGLVNANGPGQATITVTASADGYTDGTDSVVVTVPVP